MVFSNANNAACTFDSNFTTVNITVNAAYTQTISLGTTTLTVNGNVNLGGATLTAGASTLALTGAAAQSITSAGESWYDISVNRTTATSTLTFADPLSCHNLTSEATNTQAISWTGTTGTVSGNLTLNGSSTVNVGNGITLTGATSTATFASTLGIVTATSCPFLADGAVNDLVDNKTINAFKSIAVGDGDSLTLSGSGATSTAGTTTQIIIGAGSKFIHFNTLTLKPTGSQKVWTLGAGGKFGGTGLLVVSSTGNQADTLYKLNKTSGTLTINLATGTASSVIVMDSINNGTGTVRVANSTAGSTYYFSANGFPINCGALQCGPANATSITAYNLGSATHTITSFAGATDNTGTGYDTLGTGKIICSGAWTFGSAHNVNPGTSRVYYTGTGAATWTTANKPFAFLIDSGAALSKLTFSGKIYADSALILRSGKFDQGVATDTIFCRDYFNYSPDSAYMTSDNRVTRHYYRDPLAVLVKRTAGFIYLDTTVSTVHNFTAGNNAIGPVIGKRIAFQDSGRIQRLYLGDSSVLTFAPSYGVRIDTTDTATLNGVAGKLNYYRGSVSGGPPARLHLPADVALSYTYWKDICLPVITVDAAWSRGNRSGGGNLCP